MWTHFVTDNIHDRSEQVFAHYETVKTSLQLDLTLSTSQLDIGKNRTLYILLEVGNIT